MQRTSTLVNDLHANTSNALCCTHYIANVIYHNFLHSDVSYGFNGKNVSVILEFLFISQLNQNLRSAAILICETETITKMIHVFPHMDVMCVIFTVVSLRNLYISLESTGKRHISKLTHSFKFSLYSSNNNKRKKSNTKIHA